MTVIAAPAWIHGTLCVPTSPTATVMVLVPGITYDETYWNFPYQPELYSFSAAMNKAGYATFTLDRLGTGASAKPPSALVTNTTDAASVHQVISALRGGAVDDQSFTKVIVGGHSGGATIALQEAATYHDVDGVLITGLAHHVNDLHITDVYASTYPAALDPSFAGQGLDPGYVTTRPGTRYQDFYAPASVDPEVLATDERTKSVFSLTEVPDAFAFGVLTEYSAGIDAPVLIADGQEDQVVCGGGTGSDCSSAQALLASEQPYYSAAACLHTFLLPGAGHDINLAENPAPYHQAVAQWADAYVGTTSGPPPTRCPAL